MGSQSLFSLFSLFPFLVSPSRGVVTKSSPCRELSLRVINTLAFSVCHGALTFQEYWNLMLPNTPMPAAVRDHLEDANAVTGVDGKPVKIDLGAKPVFGRYHDTGDAGAVTSMDSKHVKVDLGAKPVFGRYPDTGDAGAVTGVDGKLVRIDLGAKPVFGRYPDTRDAGAVTGVDGKPVKIDLGAKPVFGRYPDTGDAGAVTGVDSKPVKVDLGAKPVFGRYPDTGDAGAVTGVDGKPVKIDLGAKPVFGRYPDTGDAGAVTGVDSKPVKVDLGVKPVFGRYPDTGDAGAVTGVDGKPVKIDLGAKPVFGRYSDTGDAGAFTGVDGKPVKIDLGAKPVFGRYHDTGDAGVVTGVDGNPNSLYSRKLSFGTSTRPNHHNPVVTVQSGRVDHPKAPDFFLERDLHVGAQMNASFDRGLTGDKFLHREVAETIPFSSKEFRDILRRFAVPPGSALANKFESTIRGCEMPPTPSEKKLCATSLESMVEFVISTLGTKDLQTLTTAIRKDASTQLYTVQSWTVVPTPNWMITVCHVHKYPYTVFNCHGIPQTKPYVVKMVGEDGTPVDAAVLCHMDTSEWSPMFYALQLLMVRPGEASVCHLLPDGDVLWFPRSATETAHTAMCGCMHGIINKLDCVFAVKRPHA